MIMRIFHENKESESIILVPIQGAGVRVKFTYQEMILPGSIRDMVDKHWRELSLQNPSLFRGQLFTVSSWNVGNGTNVHIRVSASDYAHYLATLYAVIPRRFFCRSLHVSVIVSTIDNCLIFGRMGANTSTPGQIQCVGGGVTPDHLFPNSDCDVDIFSAVRKELAEELCTDVVMDESFISFVPYFLKYGGKLGNIGIFFKAEMPLSSNEIIDNHFDALRRSALQGEPPPEFSELIAVPTNEQNTEHFIYKYKHQLCEYIPSLLREMRIY